MRYHLTPVRMAIIKKSFTNNNAGERVWRKGNPPMLLVGVPISTENSMLLLLLLLSRFSCVRLCATPQMAAYQAPPSLGFSTSVHSTANLCLSFAATWKDSDSIMLSEESQTEKDQYCTISVIYGI